MHRRRRDHRPRRVVVGTRSARLDDRRPAYVANSTLPANQVIPAGAIIINNKRIHDFQGILWRPPRRNLHQQPANGLRPVVIFAEES